MRAVLKHSERRGERVFLEEALHYNEALVEANGAGAYTLCTTCLHLNLQEEYCPKHGRILTGDKCPVCGRSAQYKPRLTCSHCGNESAWQVMVSRDNVRIYSYFIKRLLENTRQPEGWVEYAHAQHIERLKRALLVHGRPLAKWFVKRTKVIGSVPGEEDEWEYE